MSGLSDAGELLVTQRRGAVGADKLSLYSPRSGDVVPVVSRTPAKTQADAKSQIANGVANADWTVWAEVGFTLEEGEWTIWSQDRHTGDVRKVKSFDPGSNGRAVPGSESAISLLGDLATWSAPIEVPGSKAAPRVYVADLRAGTVERLEVEARGPSLVAPDRIVAMVAAGIDEASGKVLAAPADIALPGGGVTIQPWLDPARTVAFGASGTGEIATQIVTGATEDSPSVARVVVRDAAGAVRPFDLQADWGPSAAGDEFVAWQDQFHFWALLAGADAPVLLAEIPDDTWGIAFMVHGPFVYWWTDTVGAAGVAGVHRLSKVTCPG